MWAGRVSPAAPRPTRRRAPGEEEDDGCFHTYLCRVHGLTCKSVRKYANICDQMEQGRGLLKTILSRAGLPRAKWTTPEGVTEVHQSVENKKQKDALACALRKYMEWERWRGGARAPQRRRRTTPSNKAGRGARRGAAVREAAAAAAWKQKHNIVTGSARVAAAAPGLALPPRAKRERPPEREATDAVAWKRRHGILVEGGVPPQRRPPPSPAQDQGAGALVPVTPTPAARAPGQHYVATIERGPSPPQDLEPYEGGLLGRQTLSAEAVRARLLRYPKGARPPLWRAAWGEDLLRLPEAPSNGQVLVYSPAERAHYYVSEGAVQRSDETDALASALARIHCAALLSKDSPSEARAARARLLRDYHPDKTNGCARWATAINYIQLCFADVDGRQQ